MKYLIRKWNCAVCGSSVLYDTASETILCDCGRVGSSASREQLLDNFTEIK